jgi:hypothetical protein
VYQQIEKPEALDWERGRFLVHQKCRDCHPTGDDFADYDRRDWQARVASERQREGGELTDREAELIVLYLKKMYP